MHFEEKQFLKINLPKQNIATRKTRRIVAITAILRNMRIRTNWNRTIYRSKLRPFNFQALQPFSSPMFYHRTRKTSLLHTFCKLLVMSHRVKLSDKTSQMLWSSSGILRENVSINLLVIVIKNSIIFRTGIFVILEFQKVSNVSENCRIFVIKIGKECNLIQMINNFRACQNKKIILEVNE